MHARSPPGPECRLFLEADIVIDKSRDDWAPWLAALIHHAQVRLVRFFQTYAQAKAARQHAPNGYRAIFDANGVATLKDAKPKTG